MQWKETWSQNIGTLNKKHYFLCGINIALGPSWWVFPSIREKGTQQESWKVLLWIIAFFLVSDTPTYLNIYVTLIFIFGCYSSSDLFGVWIPEPLLPLFAPTVAGNSWLGSPLSDFHSFFISWYNFLSFSFSFASNEITGCFRALFVCNNILWG